MTAPYALDDEFAPARAMWSTGLLGAFNAAGVLCAADVHVATTLGRIGGETDETVLLAVALTVRGTRNGSVMLDLATVADEIVPDDPDGAEELTAGATAPVDWPDPVHWQATCAASELVAGPDDPPGRPMRMIGSSLWLVKYFTQEREVAVDLLARRAAASPEVDEARLRDALDRLFPGTGDADQRAAAELAAHGRLTVIAGGPGTGKTTTVARLLALLCDQPGPPPRIALAAPTGKAAARLTEAVAAAVTAFDPADRERVGEPAATTVHRLLGYRPGSRTRFRHDRTNRLPHDVVVIDETSMVSLTLMARLIEAVRPTARLVLVGDPDQLASVEAGAVLGDLTAGPDDTNALAPCLTRLQGSRRFDAHGRIAMLAAAVRAGAVDETLQILRGDDSTVEFIETEPGAVPDDGVLAGLRAEVIRAGRGDERGRRGGRRRGGPGGRRQPSPAVRPSHGCVRGAVVGRAGGCLVGRRRPHARGAAATAATSASRSWCPPTTRTWSCSTATRAWSSPRRRAVSRPSGAAAGSGPWPWPGCRPSAASMR